MKIAAAALGAALLGAATACSFSNRSVVLQEVRDQLGYEYHECIPLGWDPVPIDGSYIIGFSAEIEDSGWIPPLWVGGIRVRDLARPDAHDAYEVLEHLVRAGLVAKKPVSYGFRYSLTQSAMPYFFGDDQHGNNPEHSPYICYSRIVPQSVVWTQPVRLERGRDGALKRVFRAAFDWNPEPEPAWVAGDAFLRSHSVILTPVQSPTSVKFAQSQGRWEIERVDQSFLKNRLVAPSVWPQTP